MKSSRAFYALLIENETNTNSQQVVSKQKYSCVKPNIVHYGVYFYKHTKAVYINFSFVTCCWIFRGKISRINKRFSNFLMQHKKNYEAKTKGLRVSKNDFWKFLISLHDLHVGVKKQIKDPSCVFYDALFKGSWKHEELCSALYTMRKQVV